MKEECGSDGCGDPGNGSEYEQESNAEGDIIGYTQSQSTWTNVTYQDDTNGFPASIALIADFGTNKIGVRTGPDLEAHGKLHLTKACWSALQTLNTYFIYDIGKAGFANVAAWLISAPAGVNRVILVLGGVFYATTDPLLDLENKQETVDITCAGQGVGRRPYG